MNNEAVTKLGEHKAIGSRLREAREYVGLLQEEVADALGIPRASVSAFEGGKRRVSGVELGRLAHLYRRPVNWLLGDETPIDADGALYRTAASLSESDKDQVLRFAQFLAAAGQPGTGRFANAPSRTAPQLADGRAAPDLR